MKKKEQGLFRDNSIEQTLQAAFGYDDEQLLAEFERARMQPDDPKLNPPTDEFQKILTRIKAESPEGEIQEATHKVLRFKKLRKPLALAAVLCVLMMSMGIIASGNRQLNYWNRNVGDNTKKQIWNNYNDIVTVATEEEAYKAIEEKLGIQALELGYLPQGMKFVEAEITLNQARLEFSYQKQQIQFYEAIYDVEDSTGITSDTKNRKILYNKWLKQEIFVEKNVLPDGKVEYAAKIELQDARYSISGRIEEQEFFKMVENLKLYK